MQSYYSTLGVEILKVADQDSTDFGKCLSWISEQAKDFPPILALPEDDGVLERKVESGNEVKISGIQPEITVLALGGFGGRVDHSFHSVLQPPSPLFVGFYQWVNGTNAGGGG